MMRVCLAWPSPFGLMIPPLQFSPDRERKGNSNVFERYEQFSYMSTMLYDFLSRSLDKVLIE